MKVNSLRKQVAMALMGLGCVSVLGVGSVLADDTTGTMTPAGPTAPSTTVVAPVAPVAPAAPTNGLDLLGKKLKIVNAITGVKGKITSIGFYNTTDSKWHDLAINKDISSGEIPGTATIAEIGLTAGVYDKIRVGHEKIQVKGTITLSDDQGNTMVYGSQPKQLNELPKFKKDATAEYFESNMTTNGEKDAPAPGETKNAYEKNLEKEKVGSFVEGNIQYDVSTTNLEIVQDSEGNLSVKNNAPITFAVRTTYRWAGAGLENIKFPGFDDSYATGFVKEKEATEAGHDDYKYMIKSVEMLHKDPDTGSKIRDDEKYFIKEDGSMIEAGFEDPLEAVGPDDEMLKAVLKQEEMKQQETTANQGAANVEYTYRQRIF